MRFALTSEAGLNDGLAFPFVYAAIFLATLGGSSSWGLRWVGWELIGKTVDRCRWSVPRPGGCSPGSRSARRGSRCGWPRPVSRCWPSPRRCWRTALAEVAGGWGFLAVFACALAMRSAERSSEYHALMHQVVERLERLLTLVVLLLLGVALTDGLLANLTWQGAVLGRARDLRGPAGERAAGPRPGRTTGLRGRRPAGTAASGSSPPSSACAASARSTTWPTPPGQAEFAEPEAALVDGGVHDRAVRAGARGRGHAGHAVAGERPPPRCPSC